MKNALLAALLLTVSRLSAQAPLEVNQSTLKVAALSEEVLYYGFAEGDQIVFNFEEVNGKELKEVEIIEMPSSSKFMDYKTTGIQNKTIQVQHTGIYKFRFYNAAIAGRICKFHIERIPANEATKNFNTTVYWKTIYDTLYYEVAERYLQKSDTAIMNVLDQVAKVHSGSNANGCRSVTNFILPQNTVSWSYYVGVDQEGQQAYQNAAQKLIKDGGKIATTLAGYNPLAALALGATSYLVSLQTGENVLYRITDAANSNLFMAGQAYSRIKEGNVINDFSRMSPARGDFYFCLYNDNALEGIEVLLKVTAITVTDIYATRQVRKMKVDSHQEAYLKN